VISCANSGVSLFNLNLSTNLAFVLSRKRRGTKEHSPEASVYWMLISKNLITIFGAQTKNTYFSVMSFRS
jgi:hypothetical protein